MSPDSSGLNPSTGLLENRSISLSSSVTEKPRKFDNTLYAKGLVLDQITEISSRIVDGTIPQECLKMGGWEKGGNPNEVPDKLWRTLTADRGPDGRNPPRWYRRACLYCLAKTSPDGDINTGQLIGNRSQPHSLIEFLNRVQSVVWSRKFFLCGGQGSKSAHLFGLSSRDAAEGDIICILFGCSVPVVLRKISQSRGQEYYQFVGECYAHGKMDGEAFAGMDRDTVDARAIEFNIR